MAFSGAWSPDGSRLAIIGNGTIQNNPSPPYIYTVKPDGTELTLISNTLALGYNVWTSWSPDGTKIVFTRTESTLQLRGTTNGYDSFVAVVDLTSGTVTDLTDRSGVPDTHFVADSHPDWSPDGTKVVFQRELRNGDSQQGSDPGEIYTVNANGAGLAQVTRASASSPNDPAWSPDCTKIVYSHTGTSGSNEIAVVNADGTDAHDVTSRSTYHQSFMPNWQPLPGGGLVTCASVPPPPPSDTTNPRVAIATPAAAAQYSLGQSVTAGYSCNDEAGGSGVASCVGEVDGTPVADGAVLPTNAAGTHTVKVTATDNASNSASDTRTYEVLAGSTSQVVSGGDTVTTDPGGGGATADVPVQTAIIVPSGVSGNLSIDLQTTSGTTPTGYSFFGKQVQLEGPPATASAPYVVTFSVDSSLLGDVAPADLQIFRNGAVVTGCRDATAAIPDPCVASRSIGPGGDALITVRTSAFSIWNVGALQYAVSAFASPILAPPKVNGATAGSTVQLRFTLGGNRGLDVFAVGYPRSAAYSCGGALPSPSAGTATTGVLTYDTSKRAYMYAWKTPKAKGCSQLAIRFRDGSLKTLLFSLK